VIAHGRPGGAGRARCVLFDHDDTLVPTFALRVEAFAVALREVLGGAMDAAAIFRAHSGRNIEHVARTLTCGDALAAARLVRVYRDVYYADAVRALAPFPGIAETLQTLRAGGARIAVVTSKLREGAQGELKRAGLLDLVEFVVGGNDVAHPKPAPDAVLQALQRLGMVPETALMVGDTPPDLLAARSAGASSGAALWGTQDRAALLDLSPTFVFEHPAELLERFAERPVQRFLNAPS
jgi:AHBA synthesis associated protein